MRRLAQPVFILLGCLGTLSLPPATLRGQMIEFESGGLRYQTVTREGFTVMYAQLPTKVRNYTVIQVAVSNGSPSVRDIKPEDFTYIGNDGKRVAATPAKDVVAQFLRRAGRDDVVRLVSTYEMSIYGLNRFQSTNGYEVRRQNALAEVTSLRLKAAATAAAIALVPSKLKPGESTDGAVFFAMDDLPWGPGKLVARTASEEFEFEVGGLKHPGELIRRP